MDGAAAAAAAAAAAPAHAASAAVGSTGDPAAAPATTATASADAAAAVRPQDVVGAVSRRAVPLSDSDSDSDDDDGGGGGRGASGGRGDVVECRRVFGLVDFEQPGSGQASGGSGAAGSSAKKKRRSGGRPKRRWCAKEFDTQTGRYTCSTDGMCTRAASRRSAPLALLGQSASSRYICSHCC